MRLTAYATLILLLLATGVARAAEDMPGGRDYDGLPRVEGTYIAGFAYSEFDAGRFIASADDRGRPTVTRPEGKRTRVIYLGQESQSSLGLLRNYQRAFQGFGDYREIYSCQLDECDSNLPRQFVWAEDNRIRTSFRNGSSLYIGGYTFSQPRYAYGTVTRNGALYHVSVFTALQTGGQTGLKNVPIVHLEILETEAFEPTLQFVSADEITSTIQEQGAISLYGIQFEFDSAELTADSAATLAEIAGALDEDPDLSVYVVGHTDNVGAYDYNRDLSSERAGAVVEALVRDYGISPGRLTPIGIGPVAPKASNDSDPGRAQNRRVELVKQ